MQRHYDAIREHCMKWDEYKRQGKIIEYLTLFTTSINLPTPPNYDEPTTPTVVNT